jgi:hypothetical protein
MNYLITQIKCVILGARSQPLLNHTLQDWIYNSLNDQILGAWSANANVENGY